MRTRAARLINTLMALGAILLIPAAAFSQINFTWQGDNNNNWQNSANWGQDPGSGDVPDGSDHFVRFFDSADRFNVDLNDDDRLVGGITITTTNPNHDYRFFRGTLRLQGDLDASTAGLPVLFDSDLVFRQSTAGTWNKDSGELIFDGTLTGGASVTIDSGTARFNSDCPYTGAITANAGAKISLGTGGALQNAKVVVNATNGLNLNGQDATIGALGGSGSINVGERTLTIGTANASRTFSGSLTGDNGPGPKLVKSGTGTQTFAGSVSSINSLTVSGGLVRINGGDVTLNEPTTSGAVVLNGGDMSVTGGGQLTLSAPLSTGGTVRINNGRTLTIDGGKLTCARILTNSDGLVRLNDGSEPALVIGEVDGSSVTSTFAGTFEDAAGGTGTVRKVGTGTLYLNGMNTNSGGVQVVEGTLGGTGSVAGTTVVGSGAAIAPGVSAGVMTFEDVVFEAGSSLEIEIGGFELGHDWLMSTGDVALAGTLDLSYINSFSAATGDSFLIVQAASISGQFDNVIFPDGQSWNIAYDEAAGAVSVNLCESPESGNCADCSAGEAVVQNRTKGTLHFSIQGAIDAADSGDVLELSACVFVERELRFNNKTITLRGQGAELTAIDGENEVGAIAIINGSADVTIEAMSIRNGTWIDSNGGGGGLNALSANASLVVRDAVIESNLGFRAGGIYVQAARVTVERCVFRDNEPAFSGTGASFSVFNGGELTILNSLFVDETANLRLGYLQSNGPETTVNIVNCTFADFNGPNFIHTSDANCTVNVWNTVFDNSASAFSTSSGGTVNTMRCLYDGATGDNIDGLPTFVDSANGDYRLAAGSLGIDAADDDAYVAAGGGVIDLAGDVRRFDDVCTTDSGLGTVSYVDVGAFEFQGGFDTDGDSIPDDCDDCPSVPNAWNITQDTYFPTIQSAIDAANNDDEIELAPCVFVERRLMFGDKRITLRGQGPELTIIDGEHEVGAIVFIEGSADVTIENVSILNGMEGDSAAGAGVNVISSTASLIMRNSTIAGNSGLFVGGLYVDGSSVQVERCVFRDNSASLSGGAASFIVFSGGDVSISNSLFVDETALLRLGYLQSNGPATVVDIVNCTFAELSGQKFLHANDANCTVNVWNSVFDDSASAFSAVNGGTVNTSRCLYAGATGDNIDGIPTFVDSANGDYRLAAGSLGIDAADDDAYVAMGGGPIDLAGDARRFDDVCTTDIGLGAVGYLDAGAFEYQGGVDSDGDGLPDECDLCPGGLLTASTADELINAINCANEDTDTSTIYLEDDIVLTSVDNDGHGASGTPRIDTRVVIEGQGHVIERDANAMEEFRLLTVILTGELTLNDTTLRNGHAATSTFSGYRGGGAIFVARADLTMNNCIVEGNEGNREAALFLFQNDATATLNNVAFVDNTSSQNGNAGAISIFDGSPVVISNCLFSGNSAARGGAIFAPDPDAMLTITNSIFTGNASQFDSDGGGINIGGTLDLINCTIAGNAVNTGGGLHVAAGGVANVVNTLVWGNDAASGPQVHNDGTLNISYTGLEAGLSAVTGSGTINDGGGNLEIAFDDPVFVDAVDAAMAPTSAGDYHLSADSVAIDRGSDAEATNAGLAFDFDGDDRILLGAVDMGADEATACSDADNDGVCDVDDICPGFDDTIDSDNDGFPDGCDVCPLRATGDVDGDMNVDINDVPVFAAVLLDPTNATAEELCAADANEDGVVDGLDIEGFMNSLY